MGQGKLFHNANIVLTDGILQNGCLAVAGGRIAEVLSSAREAKPGEERIDAKGAYIIPGLIDLHVHGGGGFDFTEATPDEALDCARMHLSHGTTSLYPTIAAASRPRMENALGTLARVAREFPVLKGVHLEGPYLSPAQRGAQPLESLRLPLAEEYLSLWERFPIIRRWTVAPELPGALEMGRALSERGVQMSIGHSDASFDQVRNAIVHGYTSVTHLYSGCSTVHRVNAFRHAGLVEAGLYFDSLYVEMIADGCHLPASLLSLIYKVKGPRRICLVTDALASAGVPGISGIVFDKSLQTPVLIEDGVAKMPDRSCFAGSIATAHRLVQVMVQRAGAGLADAVWMASTAPAMLMGLDGTKGRLASGMDADLVLLDEALRVQAVYLGGNLVHGRDISPGFPA